MTDTPTPPDGWYPDPAGGGGLRRWNGTGWTDEVRSLTGEPVAPSEPHHDAGHSAVGETSSVAGDSVAQETASEHEHDATSTGHTAASPDVTDAYRHDAAENTATDHNPAGHNPAGHDATGQDAAGHDAAGHDATDQGASHDAAAPLTASEPAVSEPTVHGSAGSPIAASPTAEGGEPGTGATVGAGVPPVPPVTPPSAPTAPPSAPAYTSAPAFPTAPSYPSAASYGAGAAAAGAAYGTAPGYPSAAPVSYDAEPRRDIKTNTVWVWLMVFLPLLSVLGVVMFDWSSYIRDSFYAGVYSYESGDTSVAGTSAATTLITVVSSVVTLVVSALTVLFAFLDWRQLRARGVERPFHWAWSFFVLAIGSGLVYIIGRGVILRRRTASGLAPIWASIAVNLVAVIAVLIWAVVLIAQVANLVNEFSSTYGY